MQDCNKFIICGSANLEFFIRKSENLLNQGCKIYQIKKEDDNLIYSYSVCDDYEQIFLVLTRNEILLYSHLSIEKTFDIYKELMK